MKYSISYIHVDIYIDICRVYSILKLRDIIAKFNYMWYCRGINNISLFMSLDKVREIFLKYIEK